MYVITAYERRHTFSTLEGAQAAAQRILDATGVIVGITHELRSARLGVPERTAEDVAIVTFSTRRRTAAPQFIRARVEIAGLFDVSGARITRPHIVSQGDGWLTWEARLLAPYESDTPRD